MKQQHSAGWSARATQILLVVAAGGALVPSGCGLGSSPAPAERTGVLGDLVDSTRNWFGGGTLVATGRVRVGGELPFTDGRRQCGLNLLGLEPAGGWGSEGGPRQFGANAVLWCEGATPFPFTNALTPALLECAPLGLNVRITPDTFNGTEAEVEVYAGPQAGPTAGGVAASPAPSPGPVPTLPGADYGNSDDRYWLLCTNLAQGRTCERATHDCVASVGDQPWDPETYRCVPRAANGRCTWGGGMIFRECRTESGLPAMGWQFCSSSSAWYPCALPPRGDCTLVNFASSNWLNASGVTAATGPAVLDAAAGLQGCNDEDGGAI